jgi:hypothetical protein
MNPNPGKEIMQSNQDSMNHSPNNNIQRPFKIQKIQTYPMNSILHYAESHNPDGIGTSKGPSVDFSSPATQTKNQDQQSPNSFGQQKPSPQSKKEDPFFYYQESHVQDSVKICQKSVIGKFLSNKVIPAQQIHNSLLGIWGNPTGFKVTELEDKHFQFSMEKDEDIRRILKGGPLDCKECLAHYTLMG